MRLLLLVVAAALGPLGSAITPPVGTIKAVPALDIVRPFCRTCSLFQRCPPEYTCRYSLTLATSPSLTKPIRKGCCVRCPRVRKAWSTLSCQERLHYVNAVKALKAQEPVKFKQLVDMHLQNGGYAHGSAGFLPWHRWYLLQFETMLRKLPGYECISVPYWDSERDAGNEAMSAPLRDTTMGDLTSHPPQTLKCVDSGIAVGWTASDGICLRRQHRDQIGFTGEAGIASIITGNNQYQFFRPQIEGSPHAAPHVFIGGHMGSYRSPDDPLFFVHHCNVDRWWAIWQDYHGYDEVAASSLTNTHYFPASTLDDVMPFGYNNAGDTLSEFSASVTARDMHNIKNLKGTGVSYGPDVLVGQIGAIAGGTRWHWFTSGNGSKLTCCGDGTRDPGEWCDDGNQVNTDTCTSSCRWNFQTIGPIVIHPPLKVVEVAPFADVRVQKAFVELRAKKPDLSAEATFTELAKAECELHGRKPSADEEWKEMMNMKGQDEVFDTCAFPISKLPQNQVNPDKRAV